MKPKLHNTSEPTSTAVNSSVKSALAKFGEGLALHRKGQLAEAQAIYQQVLTLQPGHFDALHLLGVIAAQSKNHRQAIDFITRAIQINPHNPMAYFNLGNAFNDLGQYEEAIQNYDRALALKPDYANAHFNRGRALGALKLHRAAMASFSQAIALNPLNAEYHHSRGTVLHLLKEYHAAIDSYDRALAINPQAADYYANRGVALHCSGQYQAAIDSYTRAIAINPQDAQVHHNLGISLNDLGQRQAALESYDKALSIQPASAGTWSNRGNVLQDLKQYGDAIASFDKALALRPDYEFLYGTRLHVKMFICEWQQANDQIAELIRKIQLDEKASPPFAVLAFVDSPAVQLKAAEIWVKERYPANPALGEILKRPKGQKIRLGYFSADFQHHATAYLVAELFEQVDKDRFELVAFSFGPASQDEMRARIAAAFDKFIDVRHQSDVEVAKLSRNLGIDIAIDLKGFTQGGRPGIFSFRAAPIQVSYLGYPGTMGADYIDYLIADRTLIPQPSQQHYTEKIVYLPNSYQVNDAKRPISERVFSRTELELPETGFVFCCFNSSYKITPDTFDGWMRILSQVGGSVLWLLEDNPQAAENLRREAFQRGMDPRRLVFARRMPLPEHLARHRAADLFIDTLPCNAHTTASDALWAGLPVLTCTGEAFASRVAASLLNAIALPELVTSTQEDYEALAVKLGTHPDQLQAIKRRLAQHRFTSPLFDTKLFTRNIEDAYMQMFERYQSDLSPEHIQVGRTQPLQSAVLPYAPVA